MVHLSRHVLAGVVLALAGFTFGCSTATQAGSSGVTPLVVVGVTVTGSTQTRLGATAQFAATLTNTTNKAVTWQVNGIAGGSTAIGTISSAGL